VKSGIIGDVFLLGVVLLDEVILCERSVPEIDWCMNNLLDNSSDVCKFVSKFKDYAKYVIDVAFCEFWWNGIDGECD
jgi:hypothetical protein